MAKLIPQRSSCVGRMTPGERRVASRLEEKLDEDYILWYDVPIGPRQRRPDFVVLHPSRGILVLEVKDWSPQTIVELDPDRAVINTERGQKSVANPMRQARECACEIATLLQSDGQLRHAQESARSGQLTFPWAFGVVLANIVRSQFEDMELQNFLPSHLVICKDEMTESADAEEFQKRLWDMFSVPFRCALSLSQIDRIRWHMFPELRIAPPHQGALFGATSDSPNDEIKVPDLMRVMDLQQEQLARSLGNGHRVIHGVAGSGKTMILGYRCIELARQHSKPVLVLCYNKALASRLSSQLSTDDCEGRVVVKHFHGWCTELLRTYAIRQPPPGSDFSAWLDQLLSTVVNSVKSGVIPRAQYSAVLVDEGHDFAPEWLQLVAQMVDPDTDSLLLLYDDAQTIYGGQMKRKFSFASVGIQARGRTTILRLNYRNTLEVLATAKHFASELLSAQDTDEDHVPVVAPESAGRRGPPPTMLTAKSIWDETALIAQQISTSISGGGSPDDFAVICRSKQLVDLVGRTLEKHGVPVRKMTDANKLSLFDGPAAVKVLTMHSSKGLEFDTVFIPGLCEIGQHTELSDQDVRQEAKLIYVAMTRAINQLTMLHHRNTPITARLAEAVLQTQRHAA